MDFCLGSGARLLFFYYLIVIGGCGFNRVDGRRVIGFAVDLLLTQIKVVPMLPDSFSTSFGEDCGRTNGHQAGEDQS